MAAAESKSQTKSKRKAPSADNSALKTTGKTIKISSWNVAGYRAAVKKCFGKYIKGEDPDIMCLNETKCTKAEMLLSSNFGYEVYWNDCKHQKGYAGVGVLSKEEPAEVQLDGIGVENGGGRIITVEYDNFFLVTTYVPNAGDKLKFLSNRRKWDDAIRKHLNCLQEKKPVIWCGDLNVAVLDYDVYDGETNKARKKTAGFTDIERDNFRRLLDEDGFVDVYREFHPDTREEAMTFWSYRANMRSKNKGWRLDYFIVSPSLMPLIKSIDIRRKETGSDHVPLVMTFEEPCVGDGGKEPSGSKPAKKKQKMKVSGEEKEDDVEMEDAASRTKSASAKSSPSNDALWEPPSDLSWSDLTHGLEPSWAKALEAEFKKPYFTKLQSLVSTAAASSEVFPPRDLIYNAFRYTPFDQVKVVILGQDPYHDNNQAHGLCFSVQKGIKIPGSLRNIYKELKVDVGVNPPSHGFLEPWTKQGVLMVNTVLTVKAHQANSHKKFGWINFTSAALHHLHTTRKNLVFILWGKQAQKLASKIDSSQHLLLNHVHPSPLSASRGFYGSKPFSQANAYLKKHNIEPVDWSL